MAGCFLYSRADRKRIFRRGKEGWTVVTELAPAVPDKLQKENPTHSIQPSHGLPCTNGRLHHHRRDSFSSQFSAKAHRRLRSMPSVSVFDSWHRFVAVFGGTSRNRRRLLRCNVCVSPQALWLALGLDRSVREGNRAFSSCLSKTLLPAPPDGGSFSQFPIALITCFDFVTKSEHSWINQNRKGQRQILRCWNYVP